MAYSTLEKSIYNRTELLLGPEMMEIIHGCKVIVFGVGGVGSWCAEALLRSGITNLTIVDSDLVCVTNVNRQTMATAKTIGKVKVDALKERLLEINPKAEINAVKAIYSAENAADFDLDAYEYVIDCIDSLKDKITLILNATASKATFFSAMGAALKVNPSGIRVAEFWNVRGCPLGSMLRKKMRQRGTLPSKKFLCVYDEEVLPNRGHNTACGTERCMCPKGPEMHEWCSSKAQINGTLAHITGIFGFTLAGLVLQDIYNKSADSDFATQ